MSDTISCPNCEKKFRMKPGLIGRRVKCVACGEPFRVEAPAASPVIQPEPGSEFDPLPPAPPAARVTRTTPAAPQADPDDWMNDPSFAEIPLSEETPPRIAPRWTPQPASRQRGGSSGAFVAGPLTASQLLTRRTGIQVMLFGVGSFVLPLVGLQWRILVDLGAAAPVGGLVIILLGATIVASAYAVRYPAFQWVKRAIRWTVIGTVGLIVLLLVIVLITAYMSGGKNSRTNVASSPPFPKSLTAPPVKPAWSAPRQPSIDPKPNPRPAYTPPPIDQIDQPAANGTSINPPPAPTVWNPGGNLADRFGANHVVHLHVDNMKSLPGDTGANAYRAAIRKLTKTLNASNMESQGHGDVDDLTFGPIDDLQQLAAAITFGTVSVDDATRTVSVKLDPSVLPAAGAK